ncbi:MAG: ABC transporter permease [Chloroflexia bacterium]|nr:ABC transporter permease [Chloroflexia bacterium]MDQ3413278.1 ABC transporter permease [Chloroflexota bacterium]
MATRQQALSTTAPLALNAAGRDQTTRRSRGWRRFRRYRPGLVGLAFIGLLLLVAIFAPLIAPYSPTEVATRLRGDPPSAAYVLGNDAVGRDILSRLIYGTRVALMVGLGATAIAVTIGVTVGATAGYFGGWVDAALSRLVDTLMAFPTLALLITLAAVLGPSLITVIVAIGTTVWASYARVVRADMLSLRERDYVLAARAAGARDGRIIFGHMLPNVLGPIVVLGSLSVGSIIILESALSFLGLGIQPPNPSWGGMLSDGRAYIRQFPHIAVAPGVLITVTVLAFNLIGDGLRDALDPRQRE